MDELDIDPEQKRVLLDLFTEIAILEHLIRERFNSKDGELTPQEFGILNFLVRQRRESEKLRTIAWCFQIPDDHALESAKRLATLHYVKLDRVDGQQCVVITAAGKARHERFLDEAAPEALEIVADLDPEHVRITADTLKELRRTFDNLPGR